MFALLTLMTAPVWAGTMYLHMLDVGQGDALLLTSPEGKNVLVDASTSGAQVSEQLRRLGVDYLDLVVASHPHADHIGGMKDVVERIDIGLYIDSGQEHTTRSYVALMSALERRDVPYKTARVGQIYRLDDDITIEVMWPRDPLMHSTRSDLNSNSVVLRIDHGDDCMLLTGDAEAPTEHALLGTVGTCEVLKVPHHGSEHSSTAYFLRAVKPEIALVSAGQGNRYKHPGPLTMDRYKKANVSIYRTDHTGHITVASTGHGVEVVDGLPWFEAKDRSEQAQASRGDQEPRAPRSQRRGCFIPATP